MATVKPFRGYRPDGRAEQVACPPYDVINSREAREMARGNPLSFLHVEKPEIDLPESVDLYDEQVYAKGRENLDKFIERGILKQDSKPCFYIYAQTMEERTQYGLVAIVSAEEYDQGIIRKHELTRKDKEADRTRHVDTLNATTGPVFLTYPDQKPMDELVQKITQKTPAYDFTAPDGIGHTLWVMDDDKDIAAVRKIFDAQPVLYIADGHHRAASAVKAGLRKRAENPDFSGDEEYNYFLSVLFPSDELHIYDYNRCVLDMNGYTTESFLDKIKNEFDIALSGQKPFRPSRKGEFGFYCSGVWYRLRAENVPDDVGPVKSLDVSILQDRILGPVFGIRNPKSDPRIRFVGGIRGLEALKKMADSYGGAAFSMYPTSMEELLAVADAGMLMPPKSTWFEPKLRSGLFIHRF